MTDALDDLIANEDEEPSRPGDPDKADSWAAARASLDEPGTYVCDEIVNGEVCGKTFGTRRALSGHTSMVHRRKGGKSGQTKQRKRPPAQKAASAAKAPPPPSEPSGIRGQMYAASIISAGTITYLAAGRYFDATDLDIVTKGAANLGAALDAVGEKHEAVRAACDAVLGGASGVVYLQLAMAVSGIAIPIMAHHGVVPAAVGERFAEMIGVMLTPAPAPPPPTAGDEAVPPSTDPQPPREGGPSPDPENWTLDEWQSVLFRMPPRVMSDILVAQGIGTVAGPTVIDVPSFSTAPTPGADDGTAGTDTSSETGDPVPTPS